MNTLKIALHIVRHTILDQVKQKSFLVIFVISAFFVFGIKSCYQGNYTINNQQVSGGMVALGASKMMFNFVATIAMMLAALLAMRIMKRERDDGSQGAILSKPVSRYEYIIGKMAGLWILIFAFMFALHTIIFAIGWASTGEAMPGYIIGSLVCSIDLLFVVSFVMLLSLYLPDFACFIIVSALGVFGLIGDAIYSISQSEMVQQAVSGGNTGLPDITVWKIVYLALPKISTVQLFASSFISKGSFEYVGVVHPMINIAVYCAASVGLLLFLFRKQDIV